MNRPAMRWMDVVVLIAAALMLLLATVAMRRQAQEINAIARCAQNLGRIHAALAQYQQETGSFPRTRYVPDAPIVAYTNPEATDPFAQDGPAPNDVTAPAFLLARRCDVPAETFVCPAALRHGLAEVDSFDSTSVQRRSNFRARVNYNYSMPNMYPAGALVQSGYQLDKLEHDFIVASDTNPGGDALRLPASRPTRMQTRMSNSPNHQRDGQNVLFADGRVQFVQSAIVGANADNIYDSASTGSFPQPGRSDDVVLLPIWSDGPDITPRNVVLRRWVFVIAMVATTALLAGIVLRSRYRSARA